MARPPPMPQRPNSVQSEGEIVREEVFENCRGSCLFGNRRFSAYALLPTDLPPWSSLTGVPSMDRMSFPVPAGWEWITDWSVDLRGDVDPDGWAYATSFKSRDYSGSCNQSHYVCRRVWVRMRRRIPGYAGSGGKSQPSAPSDDTIIAKIPTLIRSCTLDRQKVEALESSLSSLSQKNIQLPSYSVDAILGELEYDKSKLAAINLLLPFLDKEGLIAALFQVNFHSNRLELLKLVEPDSFLHSYLTLEMK